jgi:hypothetical protein
MNLRTSLAAAALLAVVAALAAAVVLEDPSLALWTALSVGVVAVAAAAFVGYAGARRAYLLARYLLTRPTAADDVDDAVAVDEGTGWLRVRGEVAAPSDVASVLTGGDVAARRVTLERRTHPFALKWPGLDRRTLGEETEVDSLAVVGERGRVRFETDQRVRMAAAGSRESFGAPDEPSYELRQALQRHDRRFDDVVGEGSLGLHRLHVDEATLEQGDDVELFGLLAVERDGVTTLRPAPGRGGEAAVGRGKRLPLSYVQGAVAGLGGSAVLFYIGWFVLSLL